MNISSATRRDPTTPHAAPRSNTALRPRRAAARAAGTAAHALAKNSSASAKVPSAPLPVTRSAAMASAATTTPKPLMVAACARAAKSTSGHPPRGASPSPLVAPTHVAARRRGWGATRGSRGATCRSRSASASASLVPGFPARASDARDAGAGVSPPRRIPAPGGRRAREDGRRGECNNAVVGVSNVRYVLGLSNPGFASHISVRGPRAALFGAIISGVLAAEAPQKPRLGASTAHSRPPHSTRALTSAVRRGSREEARSRSTGDARRVRSRGRSLPVSWSQRADDGLASSALAERDVTRASVVRIQSRETQNTVSPCRTSWRRSPRSSWR